MGRLKGKVALITGGARGQGRSHALTLAREGADIVILDICQDFELCKYPLATEAQLNETGQMVEELDRRCVAMKADVRDFQQVKGVVDRAIAEFGRIDILCANAGVGTGAAPLVNMTDEQWDLSVDVNLKGVFNAIRAVLPHMISQNYGRIVATASMAARSGYPNIAAYTAAKWGVLGLVKSAALETAANGITVNAVCPTAVNTDLIHNDHLYKLFRPDLEHPTREDVIAPFQALNAIPVPWVEPQDISNAVLFLVSDEARYITGEAIHVAAGQNARNSC